MSMKPYRSEYRVIIDLTGDEQSCYACRSTLTPGPKYRVYGSLLCDKCTSIVHFLKSHEWKNCSYCRATGEDFTALQEMLGSTQLCVKQYDWNTCSICYEADDLLYTPCGHAFCKTCWDICQLPQVAGDPSTSRCPMCRAPIFAPPISAMSRSLGREIIVLDPVVPNLAAIYDPANSLVGTSRPRRRAE